MINKNILILITLLTCLGGMQWGLAQSMGPTGPGMPYATDTFEGFDKLDQDTRIPQKQRSFFRAKAKGANAAQQWEYAREAEANQQLRRARRAYDALVRTWPTSSEASQAQLALAELLEGQSRYEKAFDEYQYLLVHYAGHCPYQEVLDRQLRIATFLLHDNTSMFGWRLSGYDKIRERFEQVLRNAPRSNQAPEIMLIIGSIRMTEGQLPAAIAVYESLISNFPNQPQAVTAIYLAAKCRKDLALKHHTNEPSCREAIAFIHAALNRIPQHPQRVEMQEWLRELNELLLEQSYQQALFYDSRQHTTGAALAAYRRFVNEFPDSHYAETTRQRIVELENGAPPLRK